MRRMEEDTDGRQDALTRLTRDIAAATDPLGRLGALHRLDRWLTQAKKEAVAQALRERASFNDIGAALEVTRQSAHARYRRLLADTSKPQHEDDMPTVATAQPQTARRRGAVDEWALTTPRGRTLLRLIPMSNRRRTGSAASG